MRADKCLICGDPLPEDSGNRRRYCADGCKRTAEFEIRRSNALIYRAQKKVQDLSEPPKRDSWVPPYVEKQLAYWRGEVERLTAEQRRLVGQGDGAYDDVRAGGAR